MLTEAELEFFDKVLTRETCSCGFVHGNLSVKSVELLVVEIRRLRVGLRDLADSTDATTRRLAAAILEGRDINNRGGAKEIE